MIARLPTAAIPMTPDALNSLDSMEGVYTLPVVKREAKAGPEKAKPPAASPVPGALLTLAIGATAFGCHYLPFPPFQVQDGAAARHPISAAMIAIVLGIAVRNALDLPLTLVESARPWPRRLIPASIILTGVGLNLGVFYSVGLKALALVVLLILLATAAAIWLGQLVGIRKKTAILLGAGTAICGTSAIVAVAPLIEAGDDDLILSVTSVNLLGLALMFLLPLAGAGMHLSDQAFGLWAGTSIHAVPQVVAAGFAFSQPAGALATLIKLVRVAMLAPFIFGLALWHAKTSGGEKVTVHYSRLVPPFVWGFLGLAALNTAGLIPVVQFRFGSYALLPALTFASEVLIALSMAAMGLEVNLVQFSRVGGKAALVGLLASLVLCGLSLLLIHTMF